MTPCSSLGSSAEVSFLGIAVPLVTQVIGRCTRPLAAPNNERGSDDAMQFTCWLYLVSSLLECPTLSRCSMPRSSLDEVASEGLPF